MKNSPRIKLLTLCIGAALVQMASQPALADSGVGVDTSIGNAANPGYAKSGPVERDPDAPAVLRTPTGQMYLYPPLMGEATTGAQVEGSLDIGYTAESGENADNGKRNEYTDTRAGGVSLESFGVSADSADARYFSLKGGSVSHDDQFYEVRLGKYNDWKVRAFYNETQHVFTSTWKSLFSGEGTGNLTTGLKQPSMQVSGDPTVGTGTCTAAAPCWAYNGNVYSNATALLAINGATGTADATGVIVAGTPQSNMAAAIAAKLADTPYSELSLIRKKTGMRADVNLTDSTKAYVSYNLEKRAGARPFAMNDGNMSTEVAEPIDYSTHDMLAGLTYADGLTEANLRASASLFRNSIDTLNVEYPWLGVATPNGAIQHATFVLAPDNDAFSVKGEFARRLPELWKSRISASASWGSNRQNDDLIAPISAAQNADLAAAGVTTFTNTATQNAGYPGTNNLLVSNWNTTDALSQKTAKQRIDNKLVDLGWSMMPTDDLSMKASYRFFEAENKGGYVAYNPLTGQFGRGVSTGNGDGRADVVVAPDGSGGCYTLPGYPAVPGCSTATLVQNGSNVPVFAQARTTRQTNFGLTADYDLSSTSSLNGAIEREYFYRNFRERAKTWENKIKAGYVNRALGDVSLRVSYENDSKRGSKYRYRTFEDLGTGLPGMDVASQIAAANNGGTLNGSVYPALSANLYTRYSTMFRKYDQADRDQQILNTRVNYQATSDMDIGVVLQAKRAKYPDSFYGLKKDDQDSLGVDFSYQPAFDRTLTAYYNYQNGVKTMDMNSGIAGTACSLTVFDANPGSYNPVSCADNWGAGTGARPPESAWSSETRDRNNVLGLGWQEDLGSVRVGVDYNYAKSKTQIAYTFGSRAFSAVDPVGGPTYPTNDAMAAVAGSALPNMTTIQHTLTLNLVKPIDKKTSVRAMYRYEKMRVTDWHYDGVIHNALAAYDANTLLLDSGIPNFEASSFGVFLNYKM